MGRNRKCDVCGAGLVAQPRRGSTSSNVNDSHSTEKSIVHKCPNEPHDSSGEDGEATGDIERLREIGEKYNL